jgi:hypothetical protein
MKFNEDLATIHAYLCADGYVIKNPPQQKNKYYYIGFRNTNLTLLKDFQRRFQKYFGVKPRLLPGERCVVQRKEIYEELIQSFISFYSREWKMPKLNEELDKVWLRAFFDCEGWVFCKRHQNRGIGLDSINEKGLKQVKSSLQKLQINSKMKKRNDRDIFSLNIFGKNNLIKFKEKIGFLHLSKKEKLDKALNDFVNYYWKFPENENKLRMFIRNLMNTKGKVSSNNKIVRFISNKEKNITRTQKELNRLFDIESRVYKRKNGIGTIYFELDINKQSEVRKLIQYNLLNKEEKEKWLKLQK